MCGFLVVIDYTQSLSKSKIDYASELMNNRGPDYDGYSFENSESCNIHLVHKRLSIIDLSASAHQPFYSICGNWVLVFNGEIYNHKEIKILLIGEGYEFKSNSDTEVIINAIDCWGISAVNMFIGMFSFFILEIKKGIGYAVRDRAGVKPLYWTLKNDMFVVSSDLESIIRIFGFNSFELSSSALTTYMDFGYISSNQSFLSGVNKLNPGSYLIYNIDEKEVLAEKYWDPLVFLETRQKNSFNSESDILFALEKLLLSSVNYRMESDVPVGVFLSGGYDSSLVCALLKKGLDYNVHSFTIGFEDRNCDESLYAEKVAQYLNLQHTNYICTIDDVKSIVPQLVDVYDEPFGDSSAIPTLLVSRLASQHVKVVLSADGGDELFGGYHKYVSTLKAQRLISKMPRILKDSLNLLPSKVIAQIMNVFSSRTFSTDQADKLKALVNFDTSFEFSNALGSLYSNSIYKDDFQFSGYRNDYSSFVSSKNIKNIKDGIDQMLVSDFIFYLEADILKKVDRATMFNSIEGREPLLDHRLFEFMAKVSSDYKITSRYDTKYLLKKIAHKYIPESIMNRPKMGFKVPINTLILQDKKLRELFYDTLNNESIDKLNIFSSEKIIEMKNSFGKDGVSNFNSLWYLFNLIRWYEKNIKNE
jgi:asparagine synthase (glutamine-hydrolysing)